MQVAADSAALLAVAEERAKVLKIQEQLTQALNTNNELKTKVQLMAEEAAANDRRRILKLKSLASIQTKSLVLRRQVTGTPLTRCPHLRVERSIVNRQHMSQFGYMHPEELPAMIHA